MKSCSLYRLGFAGRLILALALGAMAFAPPPLYALEIEQALWGFDGQAVLNRFIPLSVLVSNPSATAFEGTLKLRKSLGGSQRVGETLEEALFVAPFASRWVQLYPFLRSEHEEWVLTWGGSGRDRYEITKPRLGAPARVMLSEAERVFETGGALRQFPANLFPPSVTATDGLRAAVLAHVPRWEESRRQAFLDWLSRGATLHLLPGADGQTLEFPSTMSALNSPLNEFRVGAGLVRRHSRSQNQMDRDWVRTVILEEQPEPKNAAGEPLAIPRKVQQSQDALQRNVEFSEIDSHFFQTLKSLTRPKHNWLLINLMSIVYVLLIFPGLYMLGRWRLDYRLVYGALLAAVILFSLGFGYVGRRGYGEATAVNAIAIARQLPDGTCDVNQWSNIFVTDGAIYDITHNGTGRIYGTCQDIEEVKGVVHNGAEGQFTVDIPPFSARTFAHRVKTPHTPPFRLTLANGTGGRGIHDLVFEVEGDFPQDAAGVLPRASVFYGGELHDLHYQEGKLRPVGGSLGDLDVLMRSQPMSVLLQQSRFTVWQDQQLPPREVFRNLYLALLARSLDLQTPNSTAGGNQPRVFVQVPMSKDFFIQNSRLGAQQGYVLYCIDVPFSETP